MQTKDLALSAAVTIALLAPVSAFALGTIPQTTSEPGAAYSSLMDVLRDNDVIPPRVEKLGPSVRVDAIDESAPHQNVLGNAKGSPASHARRRG